MRNAEEFSGQRPGLARVLPAYLRPSAGDGPGTDRIRYAHSGALPRDEPFRPVTQGTAGHHEPTRNPETPGRRERREPGRREPGRLGTWAAGTWAAKPG